MADNEARTDNTSSLKDRLERKISLARERDTRVIITRTNDTHRILDIARQADRGVRILRNNMLIRFSIEEVSELLNQYQNAIQELHIIAFQICTKAGVPYKAPRGLELPPAENSPEMKQDETKTGELMPAAFAEKDGKEGKKKK